MTLQLNLSPANEARLRERAAAAGKDAATFALEAIEEKLREPETLAEILAPVHKEFRESGMSEEELHVLSQRALVPSTS